MVAGFAHDVRTPLTGILAAAELLAASALGDNERRWVAAVIGSARHLEALTTLVVDAVQAGRHGLVLRRDPFDARELAQDAACKLGGAGGSGRARRAGSMCPLTCRRERSAMRCGCGRRSKT